MCSTVEVRRSPIGPLPARRFVPILLSAAVGLAVAVLIVTLAHRETPPLLITSVSTAPLGHPLASHTVNDVPARVGFVFKVALRGGRRHATVLVTLTITPRSRPRQAIRRQQEISLASSEVVTFRNLDVTALFAQPMTIRVTATDPELHKTLSRSYRVIFSLA